MAKRTTTRQKEASQAEINLAEMLFVERGMSPQAIAEELGRNIKTIYKWRDNGNWEETRELLQTGPTELRKILMQEATRIAKGEQRLDKDGNPLRPIDADSLSKIMKAYDYMSKKLSPEVFRDVFVEFDNWMAGIEPKTAYQFTKYHKLFLQDKINQEG